ncbi:MAG: outer membrane protein transport protein [Gammaproteobacteria bacterium]|nr:outer membrane protein transport protein [Gammaproteobacteria bacterium]
MKIKILVIASMCISTSAFAGGYRVALQGEQATGMGHAGVAMTESAEVVFFNPASMSLLTEQTHISAGITIIDSKTKYQNTAANVAAETDNPYGTPLYLYYVRKYDERISLGLGVYTPYGNTVEWKKDWPGSHLVNNISLKTIFVQPTISFKANNKLSVGFGPIYVNGSVEFNRNLTTGLTENGNRSNVTVEAKGITDWGMNFGVLFKPAEALAVGINYRSLVNLNANDEKANFENIPDTFKSTYPADTTFDAKLVLPAELTIGISYNLNSSTILAVDINRTYWSEYKSLDLTFANGAESNNLRNYNDVNVYRVGIQHKLSNALTIRGGAYFDSTPISDGYHTPETPRNDSTGLTAGASYKITKQMEVDVSFLYLMFKEFKASYDYIDDNNPATLDTSFKGEYISSVKAIGFGLNYKY